MKRFISILIIMVLLVTGLSVMNSYAVGSATVVFNGPTLVEPGKVYTYTYKLKVYDSCAVNANIAMSDNLELISGGDNLFFDSIPSNSNGVISGSITVKVKSGTDIGTACRIYVSTDKSKCVYLDKYNTVIETGVTGSIKAMAYKPIPAPNLVASFSGTSDIRLSWSAVNDVDGYQLYRVINNEYYLLYQGSDTSYIHTQRSPSVPYYYSIRAYRYYDSKMVTSLLSDIISLRLMDPPPSPELSAASAGYDSIKLSWSDIPYANGYQLYRVISGKYYLVYEGNNTSYIHTGRSSTATYLYSVRAYRTFSSKQIGGYLSPVIEGRSVELLDAPKLTASSASYDKIQLSWDAVLDADGYELYRIIDGKYHLLFTGDAVDLGYIHTNRKYNQKYDYAIRAFRMYGSKKIAGYMSPIQSARTAMTTPLLTVAGASSSSIRLSWNAVPDADGYELYRVINGSYYLLSDTNKLEYIHTGRSTGIQYSYSVRSYHLSLSKKIYSTLSPIKVGHTM